ncbi:MAG TPA: hypothetical protein EYP17_02420 [Candidatus Latescibacteria bacterium]|nr:hypothetical protein [Candidatus Latescibacterota bacterium]
MNIALILTLTLTSPSAEDSWFSEDKFFHLAFSFGLVGLTYTGSRALDVPHDRALGGALFLSAALGLGKELRDSRRGDRFSWRDLAADGAGVLLGAWLATSQLR